MFLFLAVLATMSFSLNSVFLAPVARKTDPYKVTAYRGIGLMLLMSPVLFFIPPKEFSSIDGIFILKILGTCGITFLGNVCSYQAQKFLPIGISLGLCLSFSGLMTLVIGIFFLGDTVNNLQLISSGLILLLTLTLGLVSNKKSFINLNIKKGISFAAGFGIFLGIGYSLVSILSNDSHPLLIAYCWESGIGLIGLGYLTTFERKILNKSEGNLFIQTAVRSSPTVIGTSCYAIATTLGPLGILGAVLSTMGAFGAFFGYIFLKEKLSLMEWIILLAMALALVGLKISPH